MDNLTKPLVEGFFDERTSTITYVVSCPDTKQAVIIDSVLDFDSASGRTFTESTDKVLGYIRDKGLQVSWLLETHAHADHLSGAPYMRRELGVGIAIGSHIKDVRDVFKPVFNLQNLSDEPNEFQHLWQDGESFKIGNLDCEVMHTPGHTPACLTYRIGDALFVGDTIFMPDFGSARCDFPGGDARTLYHSVQRILSLPDNYRIFVGHDYQPGGREIAFETTVAEEKARSIHFKDGADEESFVAMREARDKTLDMPKLILPSIQVNIRAGQLPEPEENGVRYLKLPLNQF